MKKFETICGIYCIENLVNKKRYIGYSWNILKRWQRHFSLLEKGEHSNLYLQRAYNKYGLNNFKCWVVQKLPRCSDLLKLMEIYWIIYYNSYIKNGLGYNLTLGGDGGMGFHHSYESRKKISIKAIGRKHTLESKKKMSESRRGIPKSEEWKNKMSKLKTGISRPKGVVDKARKTRIENQILFGSKSPNTKLTEENVYKIKQMLMSHETPVDIANIFNVSSSVIYSIKAKRSWKHVLVDGFDDLILVKNRCLSKKELVEVKKLINSGITGLSIAKMFDISDSTVSNIRLGRYADV